MVHKPSWQWGFETARLMIQLPKTELPVPESQIIKQFNAVLWLFDYQITSCPITVSKIPKCALARSKGELGFQGMAWYDFKKSFLIIGHNFSYLIGTVSKYPRGRKFCKSYISLLVGVQFSYHKFR